MCYALSSPEGSAPAALPQPDSRAGVGPHSTGRDLQAETPTSQGRRDQALISPAISAADTGKQAEGRVPRKGAVYRCGALVCAGPHLCLGCGLEQATAGP